MTKQTAQTAQGFQQAIESGQLSLEQVCMAIIKTDQTGYTSQQVLKYIETIPDSQSQANLLINHINQIKQESHTIYFTKLDPNAILPSKAYPSDACYDLYANQQMMIPVGRYKIIKTGIAIKIPNNYCGLICPRSGNALKFGLSVLNSPGIIDSNYRGEIKVILRNNNNGDGMSMNISKKSRIAQLLIIKNNELSVQEISNEIFNERYANTTRNDKGFGSSGI